MGTKPRELIFDIETGYNLVNVFGLFGNNYIPASSIHQERYMICAAWKWRGTKRIHHVSVADDKARFKKSPVDDYHVVKTLHKVMEEADSVIAHNGDKFDIPWVNTRAMKHDLGPLPPFIQVDTLKIAKRFFKFNSNRLDYIGQFLGLGEKIHTNQQLWLDCMAGKMAAVREMVLYNKQDVKLLERVHDALLPYGNTRLNKGLFTYHEVCPKCGSTDFIKRGKRRTLVRQYQQYQCHSCRGYFSASLSDKGTRASLR